MSENAEQKEYKINIDPKILELLGPNLYTNIYYVLAELVANAYDARANNVYLAHEDDAIVVEDDGRGMSYKEGDIEKYLHVAAETRTTDEDSIVEGTTRRRMGRKGVGKLAALSVSSNVRIMTKKGDDKSGFILSRHVGEDHKLEAIPDEDVKFKYIGDHDGTSVIMTNPHYGLHKTITAIKKNLLKIFPIINSDFKIHIITKDDNVTVDDFDKEIIQELGALVTLGEEYEHLVQDFDPHLEDPEAMATLYEKRGTYSEELTLKDKYGEEGSYTLAIKGWIGAYRTTKGRKADRSDFPDNFVSLLSNGKLGKFNILPIVGKNRLPEVYVVGQLHIDLFEKTELPDMSLSNRQGYKTDDERYEKVISYVGDTLLPDIIELREKFAKYKNTEKEKGKLELQKKKEEELRAKLEIYKNTTSAKLLEKLGATTEDAEEIIKSELNEASSLIGLKTEVDSKKKRILISQTRKDKPLADVIYKMLSFNNIPDDDIIYTNSENEGCWIPDGVEVFDYLRDFFVDSISDEKIFVIYVTSHNMDKSWGAVVEVGAGWITQSSHRVFNIYDYTPKKPLNTDVEWHTSSEKNDNIQMNDTDFNKFISKILNICEFLGYSTKTIEANKKELLRYVSVS